MPGFKYPMDTGVSIVRPLVAGHGGTRLRVAVSPLWAAKSYGVPSRIGIVLCGHNRMFSTDKPLCRPTTMNFFNSRTTTTEKSPKDAAHAGNNPATTSSTSALTKPGPASVVPRTTNTKVTGDWVLFHPVYTPDETHSVEVKHREAKTIQDKLAITAVRVARKCFDLISGYKHKPIPPNTNMSVEELRAGGYILNDKQWLSSIAGVPGMVAATLRHLRSLRLMRRDAGWIHTLLEEAENERMHLMTFMTIRKPSLWFRMLVLAAQGVFYNFFFFSYLLSPRLCHRFVGYLEEEAIVTYTRCIEDMEAGRIPEWTNKQAPAIAKDYWRLEPDATMLDLIYAVRSDETTHRFVNHSLANLNHKTDVNPFALREPDMFVMGKKLGFERDEADKYVKESQKLIERRGEKASHEKEH